MGRKSTKANKNIYQRSREAVPLTREKAGEALFMSESRIERIESESSAPDPDEVMLMAKTYGNPGLPHYYCHFECPIGMKYTPAPVSVDLCHAVLNFVANLNALAEVKDRMIGIAADNKVDADQVQDFALIKAEMDILVSDINAISAGISGEIEKGNINDAEWGEAYRNAVECLKSLSPSARPIGK